MRDSTSIRFSFLLTIGAALLCSPRLPAQVAGAVPQPPAGPLRVFSREVLVNITVNDAQGNAVHGLSRSDFTVLEDGKPVDPRSFIEHRTDHAQAGSSPASSLASNTFTNAGQPSTAQLNILLVDSLNTPMTTQAIVQKRLLEFVDKMEPGTQVAVFSLSARGDLSLVQGFTSDPVQLRAAIKSKRFGVEIPSLEDFGQDPNDTTAPLPDQNQRAARILNDSPIGKVDLNVECGHVQARGGFTFQALSSIARYVSGMPARKNLIWLTGFFPTGMRDAQGTVCVDFKSDERLLGGQLSSARIAVFPIDPRALDVVATHDPNSRIVHIQNAEHMHMEAIAEDTGGRTFYNTNDLGGAARQAIQEGSNYYAITYLPPYQVLDSRQHTISVKVDRPDLTLIYRDRYHALPPGETLSGEVIQKATPLQTAMLRGALPASEVVFQVSVVQAPESNATLQPGNNADQKEMKPPYRHLTLSYAVDASGIQFDKADDGNFHGQFEYAVDVYDSGSGKLLNSSVMAARPSVPPAVYQSILANGAKLRQTIDVPARGQYVLRIGVHDMTTQHVGAIEIPATSIIAAAP